MRDGREMYTREAGFVQHSYVHLPGCTGWGNNKLIPGRSPVDMNTLARARKVLTWARCSEMVGVSCEHTLRQRWQTGAPAAAPLLPA